ncbi:hypothetical protein LWI29_010719 [Acer saccharum]|uniref:Uncharacterized protein n=1 Tax=Acer saccharum TaxID=4024 RepID=A0AA39TPK0_ACESA|nr:hypothetical protein LWI29_010719 [Acer saccharum]
MEDLSLEMEIGATNFSKVDCWVTPLSLAEQIVDKADMKERKIVRRGAALHGDEVYKEWDGGDIISNGNVEAKEGFGRYGALMAIFLKEEVYEKEWDGFDILDGGDGKVEKGSGVMHVLLHDVDWRVAKAYTE